MGGFDGVFGRLGSQAIAPLQPHEMEHIRRVFDEDAAGKKLCSIISPREDAQMFRNTDRHSVPCECIVELYELLWRWGHRNTGHPGFAHNFGFAIPDTVVIVKGKPYAWYFISKKDGALLRKSESGLSFNAIDKRFCQAETEVPVPNVPQAMWLPMASQFPEARCHSPNAEFLSVAGCRHFMTNLRSTHSGILQAFLEPHGVSNFLVRTVSFRDQTSLCLRTNRALLTGRGNMFERAATFEGWEGLSSSSSRYRSHRHPHMEELILAVGETLNRRIEQERVRQMLFLGPHQHVALHFKVTKDDTLYFIYASIVSEKEVILQTRPQLLMGDLCMTEALPGAALLTGGTDRKANPYEAPQSARGPLSDLRTCLDRRAEATERWPQADVGGSPREGSLPPITPRPPSRPPSGARRRPLSERRHVKESTILPRMGYSRPEVPDVPYRTLALEEASRFEYVSTVSGLDMIRRPLVSPTSARSEPPPRPRPPAATG